MYRRNSSARGGRATGDSEPGWVVERAISWMKGLRRMRVWYDRPGIIQDAWTTLAACVIGFLIAYHDVV